MGWNLKNLYFLDISEASINAIQKQYQSAHFVLANAEENIAFNNYFDCILMIEFLEHLANPRKVIANAVKALTSNGILIIRAIPNNKSLESFIGGSQWKMRLFEQHYHFFNPEIFSRLVESFPDTQILEFGCFLQEGYHFYNIQRIAKNIGIMNHSIEDKPQSLAGMTHVNQLTDLVLRKLRNTNFLKTKSVS